VREWWRDGRQDGGEPGQEGEGGVGGRRRRRKAALLAMPTDPDPPFTAHPTTLVKGANNGQTGGQTFGVGEEGEVPSGVVDAHVRRARPRHAELLRGRPPPHQQLRRRRLTHPSPPSGLPPAAGTHDWRIWPPCTHDRHGTHDTTGAASTRVGTSPRRAA
jgi:hypothetical protein